MPSWLGVISIIILVLAVIGVILGLAKGFASKGLKIVAFVGIFVLGFFFAGTIADFMMNNNLPPSNAILNTYTEQLKNDPSKLVDGNFIKTMENCGIPTVVAGPLWFLFGKPTVTTTLGTAHDITKLFMILISYGIIIVVVGIVFAILSAIFRGAKEKNGFISFIDSILGVALYLAVLLVSVWIIFAIFKLLLDFHPEWIDSAIFKWVINDMKLDYVDANRNVFNIGKLLYNNNYIYYLITMFINK